MSLALGVVIKLAQLADCHVSSRSDGVNFIVSPTPIVLFGLIVLCSIIIELQFEKDYF